MIRIFSLILLTLLFNNQFIRGLDISPYAHMVPRDEVIANRITKITAERLFKEENLVLIGTGGRMMYEIEELAMHFNYEKEIDLPKARYLLVKCVETYMNEINESKDIRKYLKNYPFNCKNIDVSIFIFKPDGSRVSKKNFNTIAARNGKLYYYASDPMGGSFPNILKYQETYEEALAAVGSEAIQVKETTPPS